jgi:hypothetical protein
MNYAIKSLLNNKHCLHAMMIAPVLGILASTGCSHLDGTAEKQPLTKNGVAVYSEWKQEKLQSTDSNPDPGYEWFY